MKYLISLLVVCIVFSIAIPQEKKVGESKKGMVKKEQGKQVKDSAAVVKPQITFYELGSVKCIPCRQMQPVMKAIEKKYAGKVTVVFYDVWKEDQKHYADQFGIKLIPTQVFHDRNGKELMRHEGFLPEKEIDKFLQSKGISPNN